MSQINTDERVAAETTGERESRDVNDRANVHAPPRQAELRERMRAYIDAYNSHDVDALDAVLAPDYWTQNPFGVFEGINAIKSLMTGFYAAFPDLRYEIERIVIGEEGVVLEYRFTGTHTAEIMGIPPKGTVVNGRGMELHRFGPDGRIAWTWNYSDVYGLFKQLGAL